MKTRLMGLCLAVLAPLAWAQNAPPPPQLEPIPDDGTQPEVTIRDEAEQRVEEFRIKGRLYMIKITPKVGPAYYLIDEKGDGSFTRYDGMDNGMKVPRWVLFKW
ncbi:DUF2782 domain-containing protein [Uliginosibacterium sp. sgz301328]|uniref:DUF2782 domain-containing protein n=1 Tax=Uliginosibacterium sp. sgz301328 TaxID=3243764 RepID=UPI00359E3176